MSKNLLARYIRLSREDEKESESNSIANQRELLKNFVESSPDLSQYEAVEFCDDGYSGTNFDRPGVIALLEEVRAGNIRCILVKDLSRFGRNYIEVGDYLEQIFPFLGVRFISVNDRFDSSDFEGTTGGLDVGFRNLIYALYSKDLSQKVRSAKKTRMEKGEFIGSHAPYGYAKSPENRKQLVIDETAAATVRRIFAMAHEGKNAVRIAAALNAENIPTPCAHQRLMGCDRKYNVIEGKNHWHNTTVLTILHDERYTGKMVSGKKRSPVVGSKRGERVPKDRWIVVPNTHEAIVSEELFASVQNRFSAPERVRKHTEVRPLLGKVKCGACRHAMRRSNSAPAKVYYYCDGHQYAAGSHCPKDRIPESGLIQTVLSVMHTQLAATLDTELLLNKMKTQGDNEITALAEQTRQLQAVLAKLRAAKVRIYEKYRDRTLNRDSYISQKADIGKQLAETDAKIAELEKAQRGDFQKNSQPCSLIENLQRYGVAAELSKEMADQLIESIYLYGNGRIEMVWNHMDEFMRLIPCAKQEESAEKIG